MTPKLTPPNTEITPSRHTPGEWLYEKLANRDFAVFGSDTGNTIAITHSGAPVDEANAAIIVRAVNSFNDMLSALKAAELHIAELREAWQRGAISEHDGQGGTRSNRNVDVHGDIQKAIAKAEKQP